MSAPLTDDLIAQLRHKAETLMWSLSTRALLFEAAEALAAASLPQPEPLKNGIGGYHIKDVRGPLDVASPTQSALTTATVVKETAGFFNSTSSAAPPPDWQPIVDFHRDMALRFSESRDELKHRCRELETEVATLRAALPSPPASAPRSTKPSDVLGDMDSEGPLTYAPGRPASAPQRGYAGADRPGIGKPTQHELNGQPEPASAPQPEVAQSIASLMQFKPEPDAPTEDDVTPASAPQSASSQVTRFEVIDHGQGGRVYSRRPCLVELSYQDDGRTLKVFVTPASAPAPQEEQP